jgi:hypothetical protein
MGKRKSQHRVLSGKARDKIDACLTDPQDKGK